MIRATECRVEYLNSGAVIDIGSPRLFWKVEGAKKQTAYELQYAVDEGQIVTSKKHLTSRMRAYIMKKDSMEKGHSPEKFASRSRIEWRVRLWDENNQPGEWSAWNFFEMGLLEASDWKARWIMGNYVHSSKKEVRYPVDCFRKAFSVEDNIKKARLYITACGVYEAKLNGKRIGDRILAPGSTAFQKRAHYQVYDVTEYLCPENIFTVDLADGYYSSKTGCFGDVKVFGYEPKLLAQLEIEREDGTKLSICTDSSWEWSNDGPVTYADMKDGEDYDSRKQPSYSGRAKETAYDGMVCLDNNVPVHEKERLAVKQIIKCPDGHTVLDFGQNLAGYVEFAIKGPKGHEASIIMGEKLDEQGNFTIKNIGLKDDYQTERLQRVNFICNGERQVYKPRFSVMGYQYALLLNWPEEIVGENFTSVAVYSDMKITGEFSSSDPELDQIVKNTLWSMKGNFLDVPTDCPTRERAGWTGDAQLFFNTGNYLMDQAAFFRKWMRDMADVQKKNGMIYNINPANPTKGPLWEWFSVEGGVGWGDAFLRIPYFYWKRYGDDALMRTYWKEMKSCFAFYEKRVGKRNLFSLLKPGYGKYSKYLPACGRDFGEWTEPEDCAPAMTHIMFPHPEESTAYIASDAKIMGEMAKHLKRENAAQHYLSLYRNMKETYQHYFLEKAKTSNRMCKLVRPLALGMIEENDRAEWLELVRKMNRKRDYKVGTGFLSTPFVLGLLTEAGAADDAFKMLMNPDLGWIQQIRNGATTIWENWTNDASLNHYSKGACCQWLFDCVCGIELDGRENYFVITPHIVSHLTSVSFAYDSIYGKVSSSWQQKDGEYEFTVTVPPNTIAELHLPNGKEYRLETGSYSYKIKNEDVDKWKKK